MKIIIPAILLKKFLKYTIKIAYEGFKTNANNLLFKVENDFFTIEANNGKMAVWAQFDTQNYEFEIVETGTFLVDAHLLNELIQHFGDERLELSCKENHTLYIKANNSKTHINLSDINHWNETNFAIKGNAFPIETKHFFAINRELAFAVGNREGESIYQGIGISNKDSYLTASATDKQRLVWKQLFAFDHTIDLILPIYALNEINRLNDFDCQTAQVTYNQHQILINLDNRIKLLSNLIAGKFPDLTNYLEREFIAELTCSTATLINVIERCSVFFDLKSMPTVTFLVKDGIFKVTSPKIEKGYHQQEIPTLSVSGVVQNLSFQSRFLLNTLRSFPTKSRVHIKFSNNEGPILLAIEENDQIFNLIWPLWTG